MAQDGPFAHYPSLQNALVLITGGASGIGAALVEQFALQSARVAFLDIAEQSAAKLIDKPAPVAVRGPTFLKCDLTDIAELRSAVKRIETQLSVAHDMSG